MVGATKLMRLSSSLHSPIVPHFSDRGSPPRRRTVKIRRDVGVRRRRCVGVRAATRDDRTDGNDGSDGRLVDSDLPTLRRRIREVGFEDKGGVVLPLSNQVVSVGTQYSRAIFESDACQVRAAVRLVDPASAPPSEREEAGRGRRRRPPRRLEIGVTVTVSVSVPVPVLVIMLYVVDAAQGVMDLMHMHRDTHEED